MSLFIYPPVTLNTTGMATSAKQDTIIGHIDGIEASLTSLGNKTAQTGFFTLRYDQIVPTSDATHDYYTSKLATVTQQVLTITYADATKAVAIDYSVV